MRGVTGVVMALVALSASPLWAQDDVQQQLDALRKEVETLRQERTLNQTQKVEVEAAKKGESSGELMAGLQEQPNPLVTLFKETKVSGFVDVGYNFNNAQPQPQTNALRAFDNNANSFTLHNAQLQFERSASEDMIFGYRIKIMAGNDFDMLDGAAGGDVIGVQEAFAQIIVPGVAGLDIRAGKFATLSGYEVIESKDDLNYSRSLLFTWAIPFTHTGVRVAYTTLEDKLKVTLGFVNGWDNTNDNNNAKTLEFQVAVTPMQGLAAAVTLYHGAEQADEDGPKRTLIDFTATYAVGQLTFGANVDFGREDFDSNSTVTGDNEAEWNGWAIYGKYQIVDWFAPVVRIERFRDADGARTGVHQNVLEYTLTLDFRFGKNLIFRLEYRHDESSKESFNRHGHTRDHQDTFGAEVIVTF